MRISQIFPVAFLASATLFGLSGCSSKKEQDVVAVYRGPYSPYWNGSTASATRSYQTVSTPRPVSYYSRNESETYQRPQTRSYTPVSYQSQPSPSVASHNTVAVAAKIYGQARVRKDYIPHSARGRSGKSMRPRYITIHSTQNWSKGADAWRHGLALKRSKLGRLAWHYTTDENVTVQHLPTNEQGKHADFDGPGNRYSIGIEMCEHSGNSRSATLERTAKLTAWLMYKHDIPLSRVVPHYHWPRHGKNPPNKNCPHFLLDNGRPGRKWRAYQARIKSYYDEIVSPRTQTWAAR